MRLEVCVFAGRRDWRSAAMQRPDPSACKEAAGESDDLSREETHVGLGFDFGKAIVPRVKAVATIIQVRRRARLSSCLRRRYRYP